MSRSTSVPREAASSVVDSRMTIGGLIRQYASLRPRHAAIVTPHFPAYSYDELVRHLDRTGGVLRGAGLDRSSRIAILLPNGPGLALTGIAIACNATAVPCNPSLSEAQFDQLHARLSLAAVVLPAWRESPQWLEKRAKELKVLRVARAEGSLSEVRIVGTGSEASPTTATADDPALIRKPPVPSGRRSWFPSATET